MANNIKTISCERKINIDNPEKINELLSKTTSALNLQFAGRNNGIYFFGIPQYPVITVLIQPGKTGMYITIRDDRLDYEYEAVKIEHGAFINPKTLYNYIINTAKQYVIVGRILEGRRVTKYVCCNIMGANEVIAYEDTITCIKQGKVLNATIHKSTDTYGRYIEAVKGIRGTNLASLPVMNAM